MIQLNNVSKTYKDLVALDSFNYTFDNDVYGILGINGAGKSTLINCITNNIAYTGQINYEELSVKDIGYVPQELAIYPELSVLDNMMFFASLNKIDKATAKTRSIELIDTVGLTDKINTKAQDLSGGMKRKLNLITGLVHDPKLLICDEVCVGIDIISRTEILEYLQELKNNGLNIIYTSHYLEEIEYLCENLVFIDHGKLVLEGKTHDLLQRLSSDDKELELKDLFLKVINKKGDNNANKRT